MEEEEDYKKEKEEETEQKRRKRKKKKKKKNKRQSKKKKKRKKNSNNTTTNNKTTTKRVEAFPILCELWRVWPCIHQFASCSREATTQHDWLTVKAMGNRLVMLLSCSRPTVYHSASPLSPVLAINNQELFGLVASGF